MYSCYFCGKTYPIIEPRWRCDCGGFLVLPEQAAIPWKESDKRVFTIWRYRESYGLPPSTPSISLGEGWTPVVEQKVEDTAVKFKLDYLMPTGSFKDRGASILVSLCKILGIDELVEDSSGNAGASMAAYCACARIRCRIYAPSYTPVGKLLQTCLLGAEVVRVPGTRQDTNDAVLHEATSKYYASHLWNPFFIQGHMSTAFELYEQLNGEAPASLIIPLGSGGYLEGIYRGFRTLQLSRLIKEIPRLIGVQAYNCRPLQEAFVLGLDTFSPVEVRSTIAEGIAVSRPPRGAAVLDAVRASNGTILSVSDQAILDAHSHLLRIGFYTEPTSAAAFAGWLSLPPSDRKNAVILLTGHGLKESEKIAKLQGLAI